MPDIPLNETMRCMEVWGGNRGIEQHFSMPGLDVWLYSHPMLSAENGGDVYYLSSCASGRISRLLLADVSGHGSEVSQLALRLRELMRRNINRISQARFVEGMNEEFTSFNHDDRFATALVGTFFASTGSLQLCTAGHPQPLVYRAASATWDILDLNQDPASTGNIPLGIMPGVHYGQMQGTLLPGDMILAYTDGLTEARVDNGELLNTQGLLTLVRTLDATRPDELISSLMSRIHQMKTAPINDDLTILLARSNTTHVPFINTLLAPFRLLTSPRNATSYRSSAAPS